MNSPDRWQQIEDLFLAALERPEGERSAFLAAACASDEGLYQEVKELITAHEQKRFLVDSTGLAGHARLTQESTVATSRTLQAAGTKLGPYTILRLLGSGGMGEVYLAEDSRLTRKVALKILPAEVSEHRDRLRRFEREARAISVLNHPNIITIFEVGDAAGVHFLAMEYVQGPTLRQMESQETVPLRQVVEISTQIAMALAAAHETGVVHRDIKPENVMVRPDGIVKVLDFGLAKLAGQWPGGNSSISIPGMIIGTPTYMSPEQARGRHVGPQSDIFSLGIVMYELVAGRTPFSGPSANEIIMQILTAQPPSLTMLRPGMSPDLEAIIVRALNKDEKLRYQTGGQMLSDLKNCRRRLAADQLEVGLEPPHHAGESLPTKSPSGRIQRSINGKLVLARDSIVRSVREHRVLSVTLGMILVFLSAIGIPRFVGRGELIDSVAVLPFESTIGEQTLEHVPDGLAQNLIINLSRFPALKVTPWSSVNRFRGPEINNQEIARKLGVKAVIKGFLTKEGENLVIALELIETSDNRLLWAGRYPRPSGNLLSLIPQVNRELSDHLRTGAKPQQLAEASQQDTTDPEAFNLFMKGQYFRDRRTDEDLRKSRDYYRRATEKDPSYAAAYAGLSTAYSSSGARMSRPSEVIPEARRNALRAIELNPGLAEGHYATAVLNYAYDWDWPGAEREIQAALEHNPSHALALSLYADLLLTLDRPLEAIKKAQQAVGLDPISVLSAARLGACYHYTRDFDNGDQWYRKALELEPRFSHAYLMFAWTLEQRGEHEKALDEISQALYQSHDDVEALSSRGRIYAELQRKEDATAIIEHLNEIAGQRYVSRTLFADVYAALGDKDRAMQELEKAYSESSPFLPHISDRQTFPNLRSDPRFINFLTRMKIPR